MNRPRNAEKIISNDVKTDYAHSDPIKNLLDKKEQDMAQMPLF